MEIILTLREEELKGLGRAFRDHIGPEEFIRLLAGVAEKKVNEGLLDPQHWSTEDIKALFDEVDVTSCGQLTWEQFTSYLIAVTKNRSAVTTENRVPTYGTSKRPISNSRLLERATFAKYFPSLDVVLVCSTHLSNGVLFLTAPSPHLTLTQTFSQKSVVLAAEVVSTYHCLVCATMDMTLLVFDTVGVDKWNLSRAYQTERSITNLYYHAPTQKLLCCERNGDVLCIQDYVFKGVHSSNDRDKAKLPPSALERWVWHTGVITDIISIERGGNKEIITASSDGTVIVHDAITGRCRITIKAHSEGVRGIAWNKMFGTLVTIGSPSLTPLVWILHTPNTSFTMTDSSPAPSCSLVHVKPVPESSQVLTMDSQRVVKIWDLTQFRCVQVLIPEKRPTPTHVSSLLYFPTSRQITVIGGIVQVFLTKDGMDEVKGIRGVLHSPRTDCVVAYGLSTIMQWSLRTGGILTSFEIREEGEIKGATLDCSGRRLIVGTCRGEVSLYIAATGELERRLGAMPAGVTAVMYHTAQRIFTVAASDGSLRTYSDRLDGTAGVVLAQQQLRGVEVTCGTWLCHSSVLLAGDSEGKIHSIDVLSTPGKVLNTDPLTAEINCVAVVGNHPVLAIGDAAGTLMLWGVRLYGGKTDSAGERHQLSSPLLSAREHGQPQRLKGVVQRPVICAIASVTHSGRELIFVGDDTGVVAGYNATPVLERFDLSSQYFQSTNVEPVHKSNFALVHRWQASTDEVSCVAALRIGPEKMNSLATSSLTDVFIVLWSIEGAKLCELGRQGPSFKSCFSLGPMFGDTADEDDPSSTRGVPAMGLGEGSAEGPKRILSRLAQPQPPEPCDEPKWQTARRRRRVGVRRGTSTDTCMNPIQEKIEQLVEVGMYTGGRRYSPTLLPLPKLLTCKPKPTSATAGFKASVQLYESLKGSSSQCIRSGEASSRGADDDLLATLIPTPPSQPTSRQPLSSSTRSHHLAPSSPVPSPPLPFLEESPPPPQPLSPNSTLAFSSSVQSVHLPPAPRRSTGHTGGTPVTRRPVTVSSGKALGEPHRGKRVATRRAGDEAVVGPPSRSTAEGYVDTVRRVGADTETDASVPLRRIESICSMFTARTAPQRTPRRPAATLKSGGETAEKGMGAQGISEDTAVRSEEANFKAEGTRVGAPPPLTPKGESSTPRSRSIGVRRSLVTTKQQHARPTSPDTPLTPDRVFQWPRSPLGF